MSASVSFLPLSLPPPSFFWFSPHFPRRQKTPKIPFLGLSLLPNPTETLATQANRNIMLLFSLQLSSGTFATSVCVTLQTHVKSTDYLLTTQFSNFIIVLIFFHSQDSQWFLNDLSNFWDKLILRSSQKIQELIHFFPQARSSASISCSNYLVICEWVWTKRGVSHGLGQWPRPWCRP